ncbi:MAG TPA: OmpA family protein [Steroidobacteraceae bacterium]|nr:OmpA family protein [Steroidobacteraceae bacterium]
MTIRTGWLIVASLLLSSGAFGADDCAQGKQYLAQANAATDASAKVPLLKKSIAACPSYDAYQSLGVALGHSKNRRDWSGAADAFVRANTLAPSPKARAETLYQYASLVNDDGDPQNAYPMIKKAHALDPGRQDIADLSATISKEVAAPEKAQIVRSFGLSVYKPLTASGEGGGGGGAAADVTGAGHHQSNLQIHFQFNSVEVIEGEGQIDVLAESLADPANAGKEFVFIGHSDSRGDENYNKELSKRRAEAVRAQVIELQPALQGHIDVAGKGSSEPIDSGTDAAAMRANRRLQVTDK